MGQMRKANIADVKKISQIKVLGWQNAYRGIIDNTYLDTLSLEEDMAKKMGNMLNGTLYYVYEENSKILGFVCFGRDEQTVDLFELFAIYVTPECKFNGIGTTMINFVKNEAFISGYTKMHLWCLKDNIIGRNFYEKNGGTLNNKKVINIGNQSLEEVEYVFDCN